jgi:hypothetical protein
MAYVWGGGREFHVSVYVSDEVDGGVGGGAEVHAETQRFYLRREGRVL